jgi:prefoldin beta subunit
MASSSTPAAIREMQKDLEIQANALSKIQKGRRSPYSPPSPPPPNPSSLLTSAAPLLPSLADISKNHQVRKQYTIQVGENELVLKARTLDQRFRTF